MYRAVITRPPALAATHALGLAIALAATPDLHRLAADFGSGRTERRPGR